MKKTLVFIFIGLIALGIITSAVLKLKNGDREKDIDVEPASKTQFDTLKKSLLNYEAFKDSEITANADSTVASIDGKYDVSIKSGYYMMTIKDVRLESEYCKIVDAIEVGLGGKVGDSLTTCEETLAGRIGYSHIATDIYDNYKVLTVNYEEKSLLYDPENTRELEELISIDEINYNIKTKGYLFTSISTGYTKEAKLYNVCAHAYNPNSKAKDTFTVSLFDERKDLLKEKNFTYENDSKKFLSFCVDFDIDDNLIKYYSIKEAQR